jgi:hypothetical protein
LCRGSIAFSIFKNKTLSILLLLLVKMKRVEGYYEDNESKPHSYSIDEIAMGRMIGKGTCGHVYVGILNDSNQRVAVKKFESSRENSNNERAIYESKLLTQIEHPNIIKNKGLYSKDGSTCLVMELAEGYDQIYTFIIHFNISFFWLKF